MNPLDLRGPAFVQFYLVFGVAALFAAWYARKLLVWALDSEPRAGRWAPGTFPPEADAYAIARLRLNRDEAARTVVGYLLLAKLIALERQTIKRPPGTPIASNLMPIERQGLSAIGDGEASMTVARKVSAAIDPQLSAMEDELEREGVMWPRLRLAPFRVLRGLTLLAVAGLGVAKLVVAVLRGHGNVGFLIFMTIVYALVAYGVLAPPRVRRAGTRYLDWLRQSHAGLLDQAVAGRPLQPRQITLAAAIFGVQLVPALAPLVVALRPLNLAGGSGAGGDAGWVSFGDGGGGSSSSGDSGGGGSSCGGGGGGCGGCGS